MKKLLAGCYATVLVLSAALPAVASQSAPPRYVSSEPSDGATVHQPPERVEVTFDQPLDESSRLVVRDQCDRRVDDETTNVEGNTMSTRLTAESSGDYHVEYSAVGLGGVTGTNSGHFTFTAHAGDACDGKSRRHDQHGRHGRDGDGNGGHKKDHGDTGHENRDDHSGAEHDGNEHTAGTDDDHETHDASSGASSTHSKHGNGSGHARHGSSKDHGGNAVASGEVPGITSTDTSRKLLARADSAALLIALALCVALGVLAGVVLRASSAR